jgi:hypothetical protein
MSSPTKRSPDASRDLAQPGSPAKRSKAHAEGRDESKYYVLKNDALLFAYFSNLDYILTQFSPSPMQLLFLPREHRPE